MIDVRRLLEVGCCSALKNRHIISTESCCFNRPTCTTCCRDHIPQISMCYLATQAWIRIKDTTVACTCGTGAFTTKRLCTSLYISSMISDITCVAFGEGSASLCVSPGFKENAGWQRDEHGHTRKCLRCCGDLQHCSLSPRASSANSSST